ncbi:cell cycle checkpoint control protein RAD9A isoform X2 [Sitophilus oryzae]|uniref:Cell cycle checkpoint control protein RAD9A isoform X2 n=1 Tax=Sitophilus oryzae TaxID=7048 RepID=A0A6J2Y916_SITOR|nr:cell cycle checkpoint control protein RAD9A isoform X2 [Sitophilus oryzae]
MTCDCISVCVCVIINNYIKIIYPNIYLYKMNCTIPGLNVKAKGIQALAKIGDELFIESKLEKLTFLSFNQCKTVCGQYHLLDSFFSQYDIKESILTKENPSVICKIHMKTLLPVFKGTNLEKKLDFVKIGYESDSDVIKFKVKYKCDDIIMTHTLRLMDPETLTIKNYAECGNNNICAASSFYNNLLTLFSNSDDDITLEITNDKVIVRNYCVGLPHKPKFVRSQVKLNSSEFFIFNVKDGTTINFSLKPFRTAIQFADALNLNLALHFDKGGKPLSIVMKNPTFEIIFVVSTLNPYADGHSSITAASLQTKTTQVTNASVDQNITSEDLEALINENWEEFDEEICQKSKKIKSDFCNGKSKQVLKSKPKNFVLSSDENKTEERTNQSKGGNNILASKSYECNDLVLGRPESPRSKKVKSIFKRSYDPTYTSSMLDVLAADSDSE